MPRSERRNDELTKAGRKHLVEERSPWERLSAAMARVLRPTD